jgi:uncharacterized membrane protein YeaQ/YmgE (transglycosylase-associated protein family)
VIGSLIAGFVVGAIARVVKPGETNLDLPATLGLGTIGSLAGGVVAWAIGTSGFIGGDLFDLVLAATGAVVVIGVAERVTAGKSTA